MSESMIPLAIPNLAGNEMKYVQECIATNFVSSVGPFVSRFEQMVASACGAACGVATSSGTTALHLALTTLGVSAGDLVIVPTFTFIASANAVSHTGAVPWLLDIDPESWTLSPDCLRRALQEKTARNADGILIHKQTQRRVAAILPVYTLGMPADMDAINAIAAEYGLPVVADAAAALGARYKGREIGGLAKMTAFSFNGNKTITCGGGGMIVSDDSELMTLAKHLSTTARVGAAYEHDRIGFNYRLTNIAAAIGCAQIEQLDGFVQVKRRIFHAYNSALMQISELDGFPEPEWAQSACWYAGAVVRQGDADVSLWRKKLETRGVCAGSFWKPVHLQPAYTHAVAEPAPVAESLWGRVMTLPCSTNLSLDEQQRVIDALQATHKELAT